MLLNLVVVLVFGGLAFAFAGNGMATLAVAMVVLGALVLLGLALVQSALSGIYSAALYRFAVMGDAPQGFDAVLLRDAFQRKV
jgi:hypothetical protein